MIRILILCLLAFSAAAQIPGTYRVTGPVAPPATNSNFGATLPRYGTGGHVTGGTLANFQDLNWYPMARRHAGQYFTDNTTRITYQLQADLTTFTPVQVGASSGVATNIAQLVSTPAFTNLPSVVVLGYYLPGDGGGSQFVREAASLYSTNRGNRIAGGTGVNWVWSNGTNQAFDIRRWGIKMDDITAATANRALYDEARDNTGWAEYLIPPGTNYVQLDRSRGAIYWGYDLTSGGRFSGQRITGAARGKSYIAGVGPGFIVECRWTTSILGFGVNLTDVTLMSAPGETNSQGGFKHVGTPWDCQIARINFQRLQSEATTPYTVTARGRTNGVNTFTLDGSPPWSVGDWFITDSVGDWVTNPFGGDGFDFVWKITAINGNQVSADCRMDGGMLFDEVYTEDVATVSGLTGDAYESRWAIEGEDNWNFVFDQVTMNHTLPGPRLGMIQYNANQLNVQDWMALGNINGSAQNSTNSFDMVILDGEGTTVQYVQNSAKTHYGLWVGAKNTILQNNALGPTYVLGANAEGPAVAFRTARWQGATTNSYVQNVVFGISAYSNPLTINLNHATNIQRGAVWLQNSRQVEIAPGFFESRNAGGFTNYCIWIEDSCINCIAPVADYDHSDATYWLRDDQFIERATQRYTIMRDRSEPIQIWSVTNNVTVPMVATSTNYTISGGIATLVCSNVISDRLSPGDYVIIFNPMPAQFWGHSEVLSVPDTNVFTVAVNRSDEGPIALDGGVHRLTTVTNVSNFAREGSLFPGWPTAVRFKVQATVNVVGPSGEFFLRIGSRWIDYNRSHGDGNNMNTSRDTQRRNAFTVVPGASYVDEVLVPTIDGDISLLAFQPAGWDISYWVYQVDAEY